MNKLKEKILEKLAAKEDIPRHIAPGAGGAALGYLTTKGWKVKNRALAALGLGGLNLATSMLYNTTAKENREVYQKLVDYANNNPMATEAQIIKKEKELIEKYK